MACIIRLAIDLKKGRDVSLDLLEINKVIANTFEDITSGNQPYVRQAHEGI
jgi:hypothetical protein